MLLIPNARIAEIESWRLAAFSAPAFPTTATLLALSLFLPAFYAQEVGLGLSTVGAVFLLSRLAAAFADPLIGLAADRTRGPFGRHKPWIMAGGLLMVISATAVFMPPPQAGAAYLAASLLALCLGITMIYTPLHGWSAELTPRYHERSRVQTYLITASALGVVLVQLLPQALERLGWNGGLHAAQSTGLLIVVTLAVSLLAISRVPESPAAPARPQWRAVKQLVRNPVLLRVIGSDFFVSLGQGFRTCLFVFFVSSYMGLPQWAAPLFLLQTLFGILVGPIWLRVGYRLGKSRTVIAGELGQTAVNLALLLLAPGDVALLVALTIAQGLMQGSGNLMLKAIVADVADVQRLRTGTAQPALLFSIFNVTANVSMALAVGIAFPLLGVLGFKPGAANGPAELQALLLVFALGPALGHLASAWLMRGFPLGRVEVEEVQRQLRLAAPPAPQLQAHAPSSPPHAAAPIDIPLPGVH